MPPPASVRAILAKVSNTLLAVAYLPPRRYAKKCAAYLQPVHEIGCNAPGTRFSAKFILATQSPTSANPSVRPWMR
jgi:hypothetical protein